MGTLKRSMQILYLFHGEKLNYTDAKFCKSPNVAISKDFIGASTKVNIKVETLDYLSKKSIKNKHKILNDQKWTIQKAILIYPLNNQRALGKRATTVVRDIMDELMTSCTYPLISLSQMMKFQSL